MRSSEARPWYTSDCTLPTQVFKRAEQLTMLHATRCAAKAQRERWAACEAQRERSPSTIPPSTIPSVLRIGAIEPNTEPQSLRPGQDGRPFCFDGTDLPRACIDPQPELVLMHGPEDNDRFTAPAAAVRYSAITAYDFNFPLGTAAAALGPCRAHCEPQVHPRGVNK